MRVIEAFDEAVRAVAVSPDGRFVAAAGGYGFVVRNWLSGKEITSVGCATSITQLVFTADGNWVGCSYRDGAYRLDTTDQHDPIMFHAGAFSGGIAVSPDGKTLVATRGGTRGETKLIRWELPSWRTVTGFDFWSPFTRLAFSPNGEFLAGIDGDSFELRIAVTGGLNGRHRIRYHRDGFFAFPRDSQSVVFGWETDLHVMETRNGNVLRRVTSPGKAFADAAFLGSGRHLATVDGTPLMRFWSADTWNVVREYDWAAGGLTCVTATADGLTGVCGTDTGRLIVFDVDE
jgi:WD40 repeat protein